MTPVIPRWLAAGYRQRHDKILAEKPVSLASQPSTTKPLVAMIDGNQAAARVAYAMSEGSRSIRSRRRRTRGIVYVDDHVAVLPSVESNVRPA
jgi:hypothetical protein